MSNQLTTTAPKASALAVMASRFNIEPNKMLDTLKGTVFKDARSIEELTALVIVANEYKLNPLTKEIYAFPAKGGGIVPVISIDGWANLANSHPQMDGMDFEWEHAPDGKLISCTCVIHRKDRTHPVKVTEYLSECKRNTEPWKMEHRMLRHKALSQCVRVAFGFSGIRDEEEAADIRDVTPVTPPAAATSKLFKSQALPEPEPDPAPGHNLAQELEARSIDWYAARQHLLDNGLIAELYDHPDGCTQAEAAQIINLLPAIAESLKGGAE